MSLRDFRFPICLAIGESACSWLNKTDQSLFTSDLCILIAEFTGYNRFINYKFGYPPNNKPFDTNDSICKSYGYLSGQRVQTPEGNATVIGVAPIPPEYDYQNQTVNNAITTPNELFFDLDADENGLNRRKCWLTYKQQQFNDNGFVLLNNGSRINIWGQSFHSFSGKQWWNNTKLLKDAEIIFYNKFSNPDDPRYNSIKYKKYDPKNDEIKEKEISENTNTKNESVFGLDEEDGL
eukprot:522181_1